MPRGWERAHVGSDLSDHGLGGGRSKPRHLLQPLDDVMKGRQRALNAGIEGCDAVFQLLNRPQMLTEQEPMMLPDTAGENFHQLSPRAAETLMAKRGELFGIRLACDHGLQHAPPAGALKGPPVKLIHGLARTKATPTSAPTAAQLTLFHASGCAAPMATHSITSSASESRLSEILMPSAFAVLTLITNSNFVGSITGRSPGFSPLRMRPA